MLELSETVCSKINLPFRRAREGTDPMVQPPRTFQQHPPIEACFPDQYRHDFAKSEYIVTTADADCCCTGPAQLLLLYVPCLPCRGVALGIGDDEKQEVTREYG